MLQRLTVAVVVVLFGATGALTADSAPDGEKIRALGLEARLDPAVRDDRLLKVADAMRDWPAGTVHDLQSDFQYALLLNTDRSIYDTLAPGTIDAIDNALEGLFSLDDIDRSNRWEPLIYTYGFFNRDVSPAAIQTVLEQWHALSEAEKAPRYPTAIHVIDAVCKPVSMGPLGDTADTRAALELVLPALKKQFLQEPRPGTAFHPASHACLVLGPLYDRWASHPEFGDLVLEHLGPRPDFESMLASRLPGGLPEGPPKSHMEYGYYSYIGSYLANTLARLNARSALPALRNSLAIYQERGGQDRAASYTRRALIALGDPGERATFEGQMDNDAERDAAMRTARWLARNGVGETRDYGAKALGTLIGCAPDDALAMWFRQELAATKEP